MEKVIYINYIDMTKSNSGSSVRPIRIYESLCKKYEVELITGALGRKNKKNRKIYLKEKLNLIKKNNYAFCYIENLSEPINKLYNLYEHWFIKSICKMGIPVGVFYRDVYWKFNKFFNMHGIRNFVMNIFQYFEKKFWERHCKVIFLPSIQMNKYLGYKNIVALPPACAVIKNDGSAIKTFDAIYVGGFNYPYGSDILIKAFRIVRESKLVKLAVVCRKEDFDNYSNFILPSDYEWLSIIHASGESLAQYYSQSDIAIYASRRSDYYDFCMPIKIVEYISYNKPIVSTNCAAIAKMIEENGLGLICQDNEVSLADAIKMMLSNKKLINKCKKNEKYYADTHTWENIVNTISKNLILEKDELSK